jgi:hypothetical protein
MRKGLIYFSLVSIFLTCEDRTFAQDSLSQTSRNYGWVDGGIGNISSSNFSGLNAAVSFSHLSSLGMFTVRYVGGGSASAYAALYSSTNQPYLDEIAALYGRAFRSDYLLASASLGISVIWGNNNLPKPDDHFTNIGIPLELQSFVNIFPVIGLGGKIVMDLNDGSSFYSWLLCLRIGILRYVKHDASDNIHEQ